MAAKKSALPATALGSGRGAEASMDCDFKGHMLVALGGMMFLGRSKAMRVKLDLGGLG